MKNKTIEDTKEAVTPKQIKAIERKQKQEFIRNFQKWVYENRNKNVYR